MAAACRRGIKLGTGAQFFGSNYRSMSEFVKPTSNRLLVVNTLALVRKLETQGVPSDYAKPVIEAMIEVLNDSLEKVYYSVPSKSDLQRIDLTLQSNLSKIQTEVKTFQDHHISLSQHAMEKIKNDLEKRSIDVKNDLEKRSIDVKNVIDQMRNDNKNEFEKMRSELRYEIDKISAGQRLDLNLERVKMRELMNENSQETTNLTNKFDKEITNLNNKLDREIHARNAQIEAAKYDVVKYCVCVGTVVSVSAVGLAVLRGLM